MADVWPVPSARSRAAPVVARMPAPPPPSDPEVARLVAFYLAASAEALACPAHGERDPADIGMAAEPRVPA